MGTTASGRHFPKGRAHRNHSAGGHPIPPPASCHAALRARRLRAKGPRAEQFPKLRLDEQTLVEEDQFGNMTRTGIAKRDRRVPDPRKFRVRWRSRVASNCRKNGRQQLRHPLRNPACFRTRAEVTAAAKILVGVRRVKLDGWTVRQLPDQLLAVSALVRYSRICSTCEPQNPGAEL